MKQTAATPGVSLRVYPLNYVLFTNTFDNNVEKTTDDFGKRLQLLIQFCSGRARKAIESCVLLQPVQGYMKARRILSQRFGDPYQISRTWLAKVRNGAPIKSGDGEAL